MVGLPVFNGLVRDEHQVRNIVPLTKVSQYSRHIIGVENTVHFMVPLVVGKMAVCETNNSVARYCAGGVIFCVNLSRIAFAVFPFNWMSCPVSVAM
jgi:hypothetical protein